MIKKILIANRGEIAVRVAKACQEMGITSVAVYSDADKSSLHVRVVDEAYHIGSPIASESYLDGEKILALAKKIGADAIHPGYGFLSENSDFIKKCEEANIIFIGPSSKSVEMMGNKTRARTIMKQNNVPIVPGTTEGIKSYEDAEKICLEIGLPVMLKAASGGGGKGMRKIDEIEDYYYKEKGVKPLSFGKKKYPSFERRSDDLADKIKLVYKDENYRKRLAQAGYEQVKDSFDYDKQVQSLYKLISQA